MNIQELRDAVAQAQERLDLLVDNPDVGIVVNPDGPGTGVTVVQDSLGESLLDVLEMVDAVLSNLSPAVERLIDAGQNPGQPFMDAR